MKGVEENSTTANQRAQKEKTYVNSNHQYQASVIADDNGSIGNGGEEPSLMHDGDGKWRITSDRGKGHVAMDAYEREMDADRLGDGQLGDDRLGDDRLGDDRLDDDRLGGRSIEGSRPLNTVKTKRRWYSESRRSAEKQPSREGKKRKYFEDRVLFDDYQQSEDDLSEHEELGEHSGPGMSDVSMTRSPNRASVHHMRSDTWSWKPRYHDTRYHDDRSRKGAKRRSFYRYDSEMPNYSPLIREVGRYYQMRSPVSLDARFDEMISQLLHRQDLVLIKLDTIVTLLQKTVKALTSPQNHAQAVISNEKEGSLRQEHEVRSTTRRYREPISDTEVDGEYSRNKVPYKRCTKSSEKEQRHRFNNENRSARGFTGRQDLGTDNLSEMRRGMVHDGVRLEVNDQLPPRISSYYSVRRKSPGIFHPERYCQEDKEEEAGQLRSIIGTNVNGECSNFKQAIKRRSCSEYESSPAGEENDITPEKRATVNSNVPDEKIHLKESTNKAVTTPSERQFVNEGERIAYITSTEYSTDKTKTNDTQRSLKMNERPSMVDLSQTNNMTLPQKYYTNTADAFPGTGGDEEVVVTRDLSVYDEGAVPCAYTRQEWQSANTMGTFSPPNSYRRRDSNEYRTWLARTFTTGSGHSEDFPRSMVTKGHEARNANHNGAKSSLTDNKKMMSSIAHLIMSSIDVSSEIVQILVATPSDNNSNKDQSRKSMECLLNQSLAVMGCLPLIAEIDLSVVQKIYQSSKNCMSFIYRLMDHCYNREELMRCRVAGGVRRYRGNNTETEQLCPKRLRTVLKLACDLFPNEYIKLSKANMIRNNINMKCRKTVIRDTVN